MSAAAGEPFWQVDTTAATSDFITYPWHPADANQLHGTQGIIWCPPEYPPEEKPKRKSKWLLKQMSRRGHQP